MNIIHDHKAGQGPRILFWLLAAVLTAAGCAPATASRSRTDLNARKGGMRTIGIVPPAVRMFEEQPRFGMNELKLHEEWVPAAVDAVSSALAAEMAAQGLKVVTVRTDDPELKEAIELYSAVNFSIQRHAWNDPQNTMPPRETFPDKMRTFDYSIGPVREALDRSGADAIWIVQGYNLLPTTGTRLKEGLEVMVGILAAMGGAPVPVYTLKKVVLTLSLVDREGKILYTAAVDDHRTGQAVKERPGQAPRGELDPVMPEGQEYLENDLRDPPVARHFIRALLAGYREEAAP